MELALFFLGTPQAYTKRQSLSRKFTKAPVWCVLIYRINLKRMNSILEAMVANMFKIKYVLMDWILSLKQIVMNLHL